METDIVNILTLKWGKMYSAEYVNRVNRGVVALEEVAAKAGAVVADMLARPDAFAAKIDRLFETQFFNPGHAGEVAGKYILDSLIARKQKS